MKPNTAERTVLAELTALIDSGVEFPSAIDRIVDKYSLTEKQTMMLERLYDSRIC